MKKSSILVTAALAAAVVAAPVSASAKPDTGCMQAGIAVLKDAGLFSAVAKGGLPIETAVSVGVTLRDPMTDLSALPNPLPLSVVLADHRAGDASIFVYPWCA